MPRMFLKFLTSSRNSPEKKTTTDNSTPVTQEQSASPIRSGLHPFIPMTKSAQVFTFWVYIIVNYSFKIV